MALKLLNPGLRPLGMFDLEDDNAGNLEGGEYVAINAAGPGAEGYAADVENVGPFTGAVTLDGNATGVKFDLATSAENVLCGLADEGVDEYGTLFGSLIGQNAGRATQVAGGGAVVIGPSTDRASGKVTVWAAPGLYGVNGAAAELATTGLALQTTVNTGMGATTGLHDSGGAGSAASLFVGHMADQSLVSTTNLAAGEAAENSCSAIWFFGPVT
jgi:hypothetical protein